MKIFTKNEGYINETKKKPNYIVVMILSMIIAGTWTSNFYEYQTLREDYNKALIIVNSVQANRLEREKSGEEVQDSDVTSEAGTSTQASTNGDEAVRSASTVNGKIVEMSAYTSRVAETDNSPCISADGTNICEYDGCVVASNDYAFGTVIDVEGFGLCEVRDRMNSRYAFEKTGKYNMDVYMKYDLEKALKFGRKNVKITIIENA